ncbi:calponin homology domain-containing protein [Chytridium lagenaria]|nr:calponin homology domain-containing protein [Chytridium lagenaria]
MGINAQALSSRFPHFTASEISAFHQQFAAVDKEGKGAVHQSDLSTVAPKAGEALQNVVAKLSALRLSKEDGTVTFDGFLTAVSKLREEKGVKVNAGGSNKIVLHGQGGENITHTINEDEKQSFVEHINQQLANDKDLKGRLPIDVQSMQVFAEAKDGLVLAKLINDSVPDTIDQPQCFQMTENNNVVVNSAKAIGCSVVNIGAQDLMEGREHLILGLIWQIIKIGLSAKIDIKFHPEIVRLLEQGETLEEFLKLPAEQILIRWFNYHLKKAGWHRKVNNFTGDIKDAENYTVLLNQLAPHLCTRAPLQTPNLLDRAEQVLQNADRLGCRKYLSPKTLTEGNQKLNFAFIANLFNNHPGLEKLSDAEMAQLDDSLFNSEGSREARAFALWLNSLGVEPFVNNLFDDLQDGLILLQAIDKVRPGLVEWKKVNKAPVASKFKKVENTNYVVVLGKSLKFSLVGIQGSDITDGQKTLTLALVWQLMREHVIQTLKTLSKSGVDITDADIIAWANSTVKRGGKTSTISSFKDPQLKSGVYLLDLLNSIKKGIVNYELVDGGRTEEGMKMNAKYAISIARKLGATIFVLPEDIVEVKPKMILTFVGTLMALDRAGVIQN